MGEKKLTGITVLSATSILVSLFCTLDLKKEKHFFGILGILFSIVLLISAINIFRKKNVARIMLVLASSYLVIYYAIGLFFVYRHAITNTLFPEDTKRWLYHEFVPLLLFYLVPHALNIFYFTRPKVKEQFK